MKISIGIVAHTQRKAMAEQLAEQVNADCISFDDPIKHLGCHGNHVRTWTELADADSTYSMVLEDDAVPVHDARHQFELAIKSSPCDVTSVYLGRQRPPQWVTKMERAVHAATQQDSHYILSTHLLHAVGVAIRTDLIRDMLTHTSQRNYLPWDENIGQWCRATGRTIAYTHGSLVDHRDDMSLISHRDGQARPPGRVAWHIGSRQHWDGERTVQL